MPKEDTKPKAISKPEGLVVKSLKQKENMAEPDTSKPKIEGIFKKKEKDGRQRQVQFDITETHRLQSQLASHLDSEEPDDPTSQVDNEHLMHIDSERLGETREETFGVGSESIIPLTNDEDLEEIERKKQEENEDLERELPDSNFNHTRQKDETIKSHQHTNPWDF